MDVSIIEEIKVASQVLVDGVRCELVAEPISLGFREPVTYVAFLKKV